MKVYWRSRGIAPLIFNLSTRWIKVVNFTSGPLYPGGKNLGRVHVQQSRVEWSRVQSDRINAAWLGLLKMAARECYTPARSSRVESSWVESHSLDATRGLICHFRQLGSVNSAWQLLLCAGKRIWKSLIDYLGTTRQCTIPLIANIKRNITKPGPDIRS
jgi:hypothetical protein